jgi:hypothetical protein
MSETSTPPMLTCYKHPQRETLLRCNRCGQPICSECSVLTPTGYRCKDCVRGQQKIFDNSRTSDYLIGAVIALVLSFAGSWLANILGFLTLFVAPVVGFLIAEAIRWAVKKRRSKLMFQLSAGAAALGGLPLLLMDVISLLGMLAYGAGGLSSVYLLLPLLWGGLYVFLVASTVYYRLSGIQM